MMEFLKCFAFLLVVSSFSACGATAGPDKSITGAILGAGWGAGAGAAVANQTGSAGAGLGVGAGIGAVSGLLTGAGLDIAEGTELEQQRELDVLRVQVNSNQRKLSRLLAELDNREQKLAKISQPLTVYFDSGRAQLRSGAAQKLQWFAESLKSNPFLGFVEVHGHTDNASDHSKVTERDLNVSGAKATLNNEQERFSRLAFARAQQVVTFLAAQGIPLDMIRLVNHADSKPLASNQSDEGRQLNRRVEVLLVQ